MKNTDEIHAMQCNLVIEGQDDSRISNSFDIRFVAVCYQLLFTSFPPISILIFYQPYRFYTDNWAMQTKRCILIRHILFDKTRFVMDWRALFSKWFASTTKKNVWVGFPFSEIGNNLNILNSTLPNRNNKKNDNKNYIHTHTH